MQASPANKAAETEKELTVMKKAAKIAVAVISAGVLAFMIVSGLNLGEGLREGKEMGRKQTKYL